MPGFIGSDQVRDNSLGPNKQSTLARKYTFCTFQTQGVYNAADGYGAPTGVAGDVNHGKIPADIGGVLPIEWHVKGTQTLLAPAFSLTGLDVSLDQTSTDGAEYILGGHTTRGKHAYTIGGPGFFARLKWKASDVSGQADCAFGFRKIQTYTANFDDYTDAAVLNNISGDIKIETILNNAATVTVDTTQDWADAATHTFEVQVGQDRTTRFLVDGAFPTVSKTFLWDVDDVVVPMFFFLQAATLPGTLEWLEFEAGYLPKRRVS
jgi:hypothetical protein